MGIVSFSPKQDGTGDPSPTNVRPIRPGLVLKSKNLFDSTGETIGYVKSDGTLNSDDTGWKKSDFVPVKAGCEYYFNPNDTGGATAKHGYYDVNKAFVSSIGSGIFNFTVPDDICYMRFSYRATASNVQLELGSTPTEYEPYYDMEIYGGYVDLTTGELWKTWGYRHFTENDDWKYTGSTITTAPHRYYVTNVDTTNQKYRPIISDKLGSDTNWQPALYKGNINNGGNFIWGAPPELSTVTLAKEWIQSIGGIDVAYKLVIPVCYSLTVSQLTQAYNQLVPVSPVMLARRRRMIMSNGLLLPPEYQKVEYIDSTNDTGQYINTSFVPDDDTSIECCFCFPTAKAYQCAFGSKGPQFSAVRRGTRNSFEVDICSGYVFVDTPDLSNRTVVILSTSKIIVNGVESSVTKGTGEIDTPIFLFAKQFTNSTGLDIKGACRIWYTKIYQNDILVRYFIPCIRKSDNKPGMYELLSKDFYTNAGSGEFVVPS